MTDPRFLSNSVAHLGVHRFVHHCNQELLRLVIPNLQKTDSEPGDKPSSTAVGSTVTGGVLSASSAEQRAATTGLENAINSGPEARSRAH